MNRLTHRTLGALTLAAFTLTAAAHAALTGIGDSDVRFQAVGPAGLKIDGQGSELSASEADGKLTFVAPLSGLKTGIELRDKHLKKALNVEQHKEARLVVARDALKLPADQGVVEAKVSGQMTLNGKTQPITVTYRAKRTGSDFHVQGRTEVDITKFGIEQPCYLGVCVDPNVKVKIKTKLRDQ